MVEVGGVRLVERFRHNDVVRTIILALEGDDSGGICCEGGQFLAGETVAAQKGHCCAFEW